MKTAIIGLPMTGKTSLFTILTGVHQETRIGSTSARTGIARVPDTRVEALGKMFEPPKVTHATVEYVDMPSISKETLRDAGSIASLRNVDAFAHVLRLFASDTIPHEKGSVDPIRDMEDLETELVPTISRCSKSAWSASKRTAKRSRTPNSIANTTCWSSARP